MTPGAPAIEPKYLSGDGTPADAGSVATEAGRKCASVVASRIRRAYAVSGGCCADPIAGAAICRRKIVTDTTALRTDGSTAREREQKLLDRMDCDRKTRGVLPP